MATSCPKSPSVAPLRAATVLPQIEPVSRYLRDLALRDMSPLTSAVYGFYAFHGHYGRGPVINPVPSSGTRRLALVHRSPIESTRPFARARLRQKVTSRSFRATTATNGSGPRRCPTCSSARSAECGG